MMGPQGCQWPCGAIHDRGGHHPPRLVPGLPQNTIRAGDMALTSRRPHVQPGPRMLQAPDTRPPSGPTGAPVREGAGGWRLRVWSRAPTRRGISCQSPWSVTTGYPPTDLGGRCPPQTSASTHPVERSAGSGAGPAPPGRPGLWAQPRTRR